MFAATIVNVSFTKGHFSNMATIFLRTGWPYQRGTTVIARSLEGYDLQNTCIYNTRMYLMFQDVILSHNALVGLYTNSLDIPSISTDLYLINIYHTASAFLSLLQFGLQQSKNLRSLCLHSVNLCYRFVTYTALPWAYSAHTRGNLIIKLIKYNLGKFPMLES